MVLTPLLSPSIYTLRNEDMKAALSRFKSQVSTKLFYQCSSINRTGGEKYGEKLVGQDKDRKVAYQLLSWAKETQLWEIYFLPVICKRVG